MKKLIGHLAKGFMVIVYAFMLGAVASGCLQSFALGWHLTKIIFRK